MREHPVGGRILSAVEVFARDAKEDRITGLAAEVAFYAILSLFPAFVALAAMLGFADAVLGEEASVRAQDAITSAIGDVLGEDAGNLESVVASLFDRPSPGLLGFGLVLTLYTSSRAFNALINALDVVYDLEETRSAVRTRALGFGLAVGSVLVAAVVLTMLIVGPTFGGGRAVADHFGFGEAFVTWWRWMRTPFVVVALTGWAAVMFHVAPSHREPWAAALPGAVVTMVLWILGALGFRVYLVFASDGANAVFGVLGGALTLLLWLYVMGLALLVGGEVNAHLVQSGRRREPDAGHR